MNTFRSCLLLLLLWSTAGCAWDACIGDVNSAIRWTVIAASLWEMRVIAWSQVLSLRSRSRRWMMLLILTVASVVVVVARCYWLLLWLLKLCYFSWVRGQQVMWLLSRWKLELLLLISWIIIIVNMVICCLLIRLWICCWDSTCLRVGVTQGVIGLLVIMINLIMIKLQLMYLSVSRWLQFRCVVCWELLTVVFLLLINFWLMQVL